MSDIQNISIISTQTVPQPKPHTTYTIQISTPTRTWTVHRRYNDFLALHAELKVSTGKEPPGTLPAKHSWTISRSVYDQKLVRERRVLLETYLRAILTTKDNRWRTAYGFNDFLAVPQIKSTDATSTSTNGLPPPPQHYTIPNWLTEYSNIQTLLRLTRSALLKRDALAIQMSDPSGARSASVEAKKYLKEVGTRADGLEAALKTLNDLGDGEKRRREELVEGIKNERDNLSRMAEAGVRSSASSSVKPGPPGAAGSGTMPGGSSSLFNAPTGRVFGSSTPSRPQETNETRPLDDRGLLQLQQTQMTNQDDQLGVLSKLLRNQRKMGEEIAQEIGEQNEMLDDVERNVDRVGGKMGRAKRDMNKLG
ncbi:regulator of vacuolar morphogenesis, partial [Tremellales sp. Uapishka_1]